MKHISSFASDIALKVALYPKDKSARKDRIMNLWEQGAITAGDVERLFDKYKLESA